MSPPRLNILDLPVDILSLILCPLLTASNGGVIPLCTCTACPINPLPILLIHPAIYAIACPLFYGVANGFLLDLTGKHGRHVRQCLREAAEEEKEEEEERGKGKGKGKGRGAAAAAAAAWFRPTGGRFLLLSTEARRRVQRLEVRMDRLRGWVYEELGPLMEDMAVQGELADFCLTVHYGDESSNKNRNQRGGAVASSSRPNAMPGEGSSVFNSGLFSRPPMVGLLALLADPDLRTARLRVTAAVHARDWCPFHVGRTCGSGGSGVPNRDAEGDGEVSGGVGSGDGEVLMEIDWRAILRQIDPEGRERAVSWAVEE